MFALRGRTGEGTQLGNIVRQKCPCRNFGAAPLPTRSATSCACGSTLCCHQRCTIRRLRIICATGVIVLLSVALVGCDVVTEEYADGSAARSAKTDVKGILPSFIPDDAANLKIAHNIDTDEVWIRCSLSTASAGRLRTAVTPASWQEARAGAATSPFGFGRWHPVLGGRVTYTPEATSLYFIAGPRGEWHGVVSATGECFVFGRPAA